jgi:hypothetical protein
MTVSFLPSNSIASVGKLQLKLTLQVLFLEETLKASGTSLELVSVFRSFGKTF